MGVMVSTAEAFFSNALAYWMTTYLPPGAPGTFSVYCRTVTLRERTLPSGERAPDSACVHCAFVTAPLKTFAA